MVGKKCHPVWIVMRQPLCLCSEARSAKACASRNHVKKNSVFSVALCEYYEIIAQHFLRDSKENFLRDSAFCLP